MDIKEAFTTQLEFNPNMVVFMEMVNTKDGKFNLHTHMEKASKLDEVAEKYEFVEFVPGQSIPVLIKKEK